MGGIGLPLERGAMEATGSLGQLPPVALAAPGQRVKEGKVAAESGQLPPSRQSNLSTTKNSNNNNKRLNNSTAAPATK